MILNLNECQTVLLSILGGAPRSTEILVNTLGTPERKDKRMAWRIRRLALCTLMGLVFFSPVFAQSSIWGIDADHSTARLFIASSNKAGVSINVGVARLRGKLKQSDDDSKLSAFDFSIYPADENARAVREEDPLEEPIPSRSEDSTVISFKSRVVVPMDENTIRVDGDLLVTYIERTVTYDPSEAYSGPVYGRPITRTGKHAASFLLRRVYAARQQGTKDGKVEWSASGTILRDAFPELFNVVATTDWPDFVVDSQCVMPPNVGEDFSGPTCTGETVDLTARTDVQCAMPHTIGEDFAGEICSGTPLYVAATHAKKNRTGKGGRQDDAQKLLANEEKIELDLWLTREGTTVSASSGN
jgi:hypothetical protein